MGHRASVLSVALLVGGCATGGDGASATADCVGCGELKASPSEEGGPSSGEATDGSPTWAQPSARAIEAGGDALAPWAPADLALEGRTRQSVRVTWTAPADDDGSSVAAYQVRYAEVPLDDSNFGSAGVAVAAPSPAPPGSSEAMDIAPLRPGTAYYVAVRAVDAAGNVSVVASAGPFVGDFDRTGLVMVDAPDVEAALGEQLVYGDFNADGFADVAVSAPFESFEGVESAGVVHVYFGGPGSMGAATAAELRIGGTEAAGFGRGLTSIDWNGDGIDDLAIGEPFGGWGSGRVLVFFGGEAFGAMAGMTADAADVVIDVDLSWNWFAFGSVGWALTSARFDGDARDDLVIGMVDGGWGYGGVAVVYGGTATGDILLTDEDPEPLGGAVVEVITYPYEDERGSMFGHVVTNLGRTGGTSDATEDLGIGAWDMPHVFVYRGKADRPATPGVHFRSFDPGFDLEIQDDGSHGTSLLAPMVASIPALDAGGGRDLVVGAHAANQGGMEAGVVAIVRGDAVGVKERGDITRTLITGAEGVAARAGVALAGAGRTGGDVDGDGLEDLVLVSAPRPSELELTVWYGGAIPTGTVTVDSAHHRVAAPSAFDPFLVSSTLTATRLAWMGDTNGDGLDDLCWADWQGNGGDGSFECLR